MALRNIVLVAVLYYFTSAGVSKASKSECLLYTTRNGVQEVCITDGVISNKTLFLHGSRGVMSAVSVDSDFNKQCIYFTLTSARGSRLEEYCINERKFRVIRLSSSAMEGMALDWTTGNLYWLERGDHQLGVTSNDGRFTKVLYRGNKMFDKPRAIAVHPGLGLLFWTDWSATNPRIVRASMDGNRSSVKVLIEGTDQIGWANGITVDIKENIVFWTDARKDAIGSMNIDGSGAKFIYTSQQLTAHPFGIAISSEFIYWTDWRSNSIGSVRRHTDSTTINSTATAVHVSNRTLMGLSLFAPKPQVHMSYKTVKEKCPYLWLFGYNDGNLPTGKCYCPDDYKRSEEPGELRCYQTKVGFNTTITTRVKECLLYGASDGVYEVCLTDGAPSHKIIYENRGVVTGASVDSDFNKQCIYFTLAFANGSRLEEYCINERKFRVIRQSSSAMEGMALDWTTGNLYWLERGNHQLGVTSNDGRITKVLYRGDALFDKPRAIAVHPGLGLLFWTDWSATNPRIVRASMDGNQSSVKVLIKGSDKLEWANGITVDIEKNIVFWTDAGKDAIGSMNIDGSGAKFIYTSQELTAHPFGIAVSSEFIYWTDWKSDSIGSVRRHTDSTAINSTATAVHVSYRKLMGLSLFAPKPQVHISDKANKEKCHYLWLLGYNDGNLPTGRCYCPDDYKASEEPGQLSCYQTKAGFNTTVTTSVKVTKPPTCNNASMACQNGKCIPLVWRCDNENDCGDNSDELNCNGVTCNPRTQFMCVTGRRCIPLLWRCDGEIDCLDRSDELNCTENSANNGTSIPCSDQQLLCNGTQQCLPKSWRCDGDRDCPQGDDEIDCEVKGSCERDQFQCKSRDICIPSSWQCDRDKDCPDGSDETGCFEARCNETQFQCNDTKKCFPSRVKCDGNRDCPDGSDERNCTEGAFGWSILSDCLVYTAGHEVRRVCHSNHTNDVLISEPNIVMDVDADHSHRCIFYTSSTGETYSIKENCPNKNSSTFVDGVIGTVEGLAYDWRGQHLYWLDKESKVLMVSDRKGQYRATLYQGKIFNYPRDLVLDPRRGLLYWTDWSTTNPAVMRGSMAGDPSNLKAVLSDGEKLGWPNGLALDDKANQLYWVDAKLDKIMAADLDGRWTRTVRLLPSSSHSYGLTVGRDFLYWSDWGSESIFATRKGSKQAPLIPVVQHVKDLYGLAVVPEDSKDPEPCPWMCPHLCLFGHSEVYNTTTRACRCADGYRLTQRRDGQDICTPEQVSGETGEKTTTAPRGYNITAAHRGYTTTAVYKGYNTTAAHRGYNTTASQTGYNTTAVYKGYNTTAAQRRYSTTVAHRGYNTTAAHRGFNITTATPTLTSTTADTTTTTTPPPVTCPQLKTTPSSEVPRFPFKIINIEGKNYTEVTSTCRPLRLHRLCPLECFLQVSLQDDRYCFKCVCQ